MRSDSQDRARCSAAALKFAGEIIQGSQQSIDDHIVEDLFLYNGEPSVSVSFSSPPYCRANVPNLESRQFLQDCSGHQHDR